MTDPLSGDIALLGFGRSHRALARHLAGRGAELRVLDQKGREELDPAGRQLLDELRLSYVGGPGYLRHLHHPDTLFVTPGIPTGLREIAEAREAGANVTGEAAYFLLSYPGSVIGITGSAGKTTTATLIGAFLQASGVRVEVAGNIGRPLVELLDRPHPDWVVAELSSFQLDLTRSSPKVGAILNFQPNHLDIHPSLEAYLEAKLNLLRFQGTQDVAVLSAGDDELTAHCRTFSGRKILIGVDEGTLAAYAEGDNLWLRQDDKRHLIARGQALQIPGRHNRQNLLFAAILATLAGGDPRVYQPVAEGFPGVPHRLERVGEIGGVLFVNDSIATAPDRTVAALRAMARPVLLLAGGYDKGLDYAPLAQAMDGVKAVVTFGATGPKVGRVARQSGVLTEEAQDLAEAFSKARGLAVPGDVVLLSPASASYDQFRHFEERGDAFRMLVKRVADSP